MTHSDDFNQTAFATEEPLFEASGGVSKQKVTELKKPNGGKVIFLFLVVVVAIGGWYYFNREKIQTNQNEVTATPTPKSSSNSAPTSVDQQLLELDQSLKEADPSINIYPFPPVSEEILVSPKQ